MPRRALHEGILPELERNGIRIVKFAELDEERRAGLRKTFIDRVFPVLTPLAVDKGHPFPYISNLSLSLGIEIEDQGPEGPAVHFARVKVPQSLPRFVPVPAEPGQAALHPSRRPDRA